MRKTMVWIIGAAAVLAVAGIAAGPIMSDVEQAKYTVVETHDAIEIRDYAPMLVAEVAVEGEREAAISEGFGKIADYIFGNNTASQKVAMTAPVVQQSAEKIAMTAPVIQQGEGTRWQVRFVMPASYTLETLPKPNNTEVQLVKTKPKRFAVIRFSGSTASDNVAAHEAQLEAYLVEHKRKAVAPAAYAFFNPPWTLPPMRRNEVMIEIAKR